MEAALYHREIILSSLMMAHGKVNIQTQVGINLGADQKILSEGAGLRVKEKVERDGC